MSNSNDQDLNLKELIKKEYVKCAADPVHFMKRYCYIQHPTKGKILFKLYQFQERTLSEFKDNDYNIVLKSRQMGISTLVAGYSLWLMLFGSDKNILVIATKQDVAKNLVTKVREMHDALPAWLKGDCKEDNRLSMRFANGSQIQAVASSPDAARSQALSLLVIDEAAFIDYADQIWGSAAPTLSTGGKAIILSTPNGIGNFFHSMWVNAENDIEDVSGIKFHTIKLKWNLHPERDQKWRDAQDKLTGARIASQECDCDFLTSGNTVIPADILLYYKNLIIDAIDRCGQERAYWKWKYSQPGRSYMVCADVGRGDGLDNSAFQVIDLDNMEQVAEYKGKIGTEEYGHFLVSVAIDYNYALLVIENTSIGWATIQAVINKNYPNLFYGSDDLLVVDTLRNVNNRINASEKKMTPGFTNSPKTRPLIISKLDLNLQEKSVILHSSRLNAELFTFIWENGKAQAMNKYNDDLVISLAIALWIRDTALRLKVESLASTRACIDGIKRVATNAPTIYTRSSNTPSDPWAFKVGDRDESLRWLL